MFFIMFLAMIIYVGLVIYLADQGIAHLEFERRKEEGLAHQALEDLRKRRDYFSLEKKSLETEAFKIFTLYEMTREITQSLSEVEAFNIFKEKLREHVLFKECYFYEPLSKEIKEESKECFIFTLQGEKKKMGYVAIDGVSPNDHEKIIILGHQFALALRRVKLYQEIERIAITDSLTEVHTRRYILERFQEELGRSLAHKTKTSFLMIDVDFFKKFNDQYGHLTGDQILRKVAVIIKENIREIDIAGRYGGEEFCVVLPDTDLPGAQYVAERIRQITEQTPIEAYDATVKATVSIGIAHFSKDGKEMEELIDKADAALYEAKNQGRNRVCCWEEIS